MTNKVTVEFRAGGYTPWRACEHCGVACAGSVWATVEQAREHVINDEGMVEYGHGYACPSKAR